VLDSLHRRRRGHRLAQWLGLGGVGAQLAYQRPPDYDDVLQAPSRALVERLDVAEVERRLTPDERALWEADTPAGRARLALTLGTHHGVDTGLLPDMPPDDVHSMVRSQLVTGGDPWLADLVIGAAGRDPRRAALDFGCSSGRVVRLLAAWRPEVRWIGCDPNAGAIAWAQAHVPAVEWFVSPQEPPLPLADGALDLAFAISIWSHFGERAALRWLDEMHRLLEPGGVLVFTAHGLGSIGDFVRRGKLRARDGTTAAEALATRGHWFRSTFKAGGDWGVVDPEWGEAYMSPEWVRRHVEPRWRLARYEPARLDRNQDLYVLERA
jgi:SAM-dependent methyltransferase